MHKKILLKDFAKILLDINLEIILLGYQNNYIRNSKMMSNAANNFDILAISLSKYTSDKILDLAANSSFPCKIITRYFNVTIEVLVLYVIKPV